MNGHFGIKKNILSALFAVSGFVLLATGAHAKDSKSGINLWAPEHSANGSFVVRVNAKKAPASKVELWRSYNGGSFQLITSHSNFNAISQNVNREGIYAYQARVVSNANSNQPVISKTSYVTVDLRYPELSHTQTNF